MTNLNFTMKSLKTMGLNVQTGKSGWINMSVLETVSKTRQISNGARIIRDDQYPFNKFKINRRYSGVKLQAVRFEGYRDVEYEKQMLQMALEKKKSKIESLMKDVESINAEIEVLNKYKNNIKLYDDSDVQFWK